MPLRSVFIIVFVLLFSVQLFSQEKLEVKNGVLDLRKVELSGQSIPIQGEALFFWRQLLSPDELTSPKLHPEVFSDFPSLWNNKVVANDTLSNFGYGTYVIKILLPTNAKTIPLGMTLQDMYSSYKLFVDGKEVASNGIVATKKEDYKPYWLPKTIAFEPKSDSIILVLQVANFDHSKGGVKEEMLFGDAARVNKDFTDDMAYDYILTGCLLMGGLFFLGLYFFGRHDYSVLYFSLFCIAYSYRIIGSSNYGLQQMFPELPWSVGLHAEYFTLYLSGYLFTCYTYYLYPEIVSKLVVKIYTAISALLFIITVFFPISIFTLFAGPYFIVIFSFLPYCVWIYFKAVIQKSYGALFALISLVALFMSFSFDMLSYFELVRPQNLVLFIGYIAFFFFQSLILSYRFAMSYKKALADAQMASEAKSQFLSVMSHEIRTPLNAVIGISNLLEAKGEQRENIETLNYAAQNLLILVNDILDYSKIEAGKIEFESVNVNLSHFLEKLRLIHETTARKKGLALQVYIDPALPEFLLLDPTRLTQVLSNLINNGIKFTHQGKVEIRLTLTDRVDDKVKVKFEIIDTGIGIAAEKQQMIYDAFTQTASSITRQFGGTGLGLSITKGLLSLQGVELQLKSKEGEGSTFYFEQEFIAGVAKNEINEKNPDMVKQDILEGKRVLLVEDNPVNAIIARKFLERWKIEVDVAVNGSDVLKLDMDYDIILMDVQMPDMDGYAVSKLLREEGVKTPILAFTASALMDVREQMEASGMNDFVIKPFDPEELKSKLIKYIGQS